MSSPNSNETQTEPNRNMLFPVEEKEYELIAEIGKGATATVYTAKIIKRDTIVAVKKINLERFTVNLDELLKEIQVMSQCNHENVVRFYTSFVVRHNLWLVMELLDGGSLLDVIRHTMATKNCLHGVLDEVAIATVLKEVLKGLDYFHSNGHIHRDIKAGNILLSLDGAVKIGDFGVSAFIASSRGDVTKEASRHTFVGTPCWMAPEVMSHTPEGYNTRVDIWSFGIMTLELATGKAPYHMYPPVKVLVMTLQNDPPTLETCEEVKDQYKHYSKQFRKFVDCCLQKNPQDRLTAKQLIKNDFLKKAKDRAYIAKNLAVKMSERLVYDPDLPRSLCARSVKRLFSGEWYFDDEPALQGEQAAGDAPDADAVDVAAPQNGQASNAEISNQIPPAGNMVGMPQEDARGQDYPQVPVDKIKLTLRMRDRSKQLNDIKFEFDPSKDTCDLVTDEMVNAGLIEGQDRIVVAFNMAKIIETPNLKSVIFQMPSLRSDDEEVDPSRLIGCAMWISKAGDEEV